MGVVSHLPLHVLVGEERKENEGRTIGSADPWRWLQEKGNRMIRYLHEMIFNRGPMPFVSICACLAAVLAVLAMRPRSMRQYWLSLALCLLPILPGLVGYFLGVQAAHARWADFMAGNPTSIDGAQMNLEIGIMIARDPLYLGIALSLLPALWSTAMFTKSRKK
jgi:hypothetical protein